MKKTLYFDTFESQEEIFNKVWDNFPVGKKPDWKHWWFFRYLQISPTYAKELNRQNLFWGDIDKINKKSKIELKKSFSKLFPPDDRIFSMVHYFGDLWNTDFTRWWYKTAKEIFYNYDDSLIKPVELGEFYPGEFIDGPGKKELVVKKFEKIYEERESFFREPHLKILALPILENKAETLKLIEKYIDDHISFDQKGVIISKRIFQATKLKEATLRDCYKVFELRSYQPNPDLTALALEANVLKNALAGVNQSKTELNKILSLESLRTGTSRQIAMAHHFAENAALGKFPISTAPKETLAPDYLHLSKQFSNAKNQFKVDKRSFNLLLKDVEKSLEGDLDYFYYKMQ